MFKIFPAIDIKNGKCVRLSQGNFSKIKVYNEDPYLQAQKFYNLGYKNLHIIDLDGANTGDLQNIEIVRTNGGYSDDTHFKLIAYDAAGNTSSRTYYLQVKHSSTSSSYSSVSIRHASIVAIELSSS